MLNKNEWLNWIGVIPMNNQMNANDETLIYKITSMIKKIMQTSNEW